MTAPSEVEPSTEFIDQLLALPTLPERSAFLHAADRLTPDGLSDLLDSAAHLVRSDPGSGQRLAELCATLANQVGAAAVVPRAAYIRAQAYASNAEFEVALSLIEAARHGYMAIGEPIEALRTNIGRMNVLSDLGHYQAALDAGQLVLSKLERGDVPASRETQLLIALAHQGQGVCYEQIGRYDQALAAYAAAEPYYAALAMPDRLGEISNNRGVVLVNLGRGGEALAAFETARATFAAAGLRLLQAQTLINIGEAHMLLGSYTLGLSTFKQARELFAALNALAEQHVLLIDTADAYLALNLYPEALAAYREAEELLQAAGMPHYRARALLGIGVVLIAQAQLDQAERALDEAVALFAAADNQPMLSSVLLEQAALLAERRDRTAALPVARQALALSLEHTWPVQQVYAHMRMADLEIADLAVAERQLLEAQGIAHALGLPQLRYRLNQRLGHIRMAQGRDAEAQQLLEAAVAEIEQLRGNLAHETTRTSFLRDKVAAYDDLVALYLGRDNEQAIWQAFASAERAKSRTLVDMLTGIIETRPDATSNLQAADQIRARQADLNAVYNELLGSSGDAQQPVIDDLRQQRALQLEHEISRLRLQETFTAATRDTLALPPSIAAKQDQLPADLTLLAYHIIGDEIIAFICSHGRIRCARQVCAVAAAQRQLEHLAIQWERFRAGPAFVEQHLHWLEQTAQRALLALYDLLIAPLDGLLEQVTAGATPKLAIVPHGLLHQVPFHALYDGSRYLIERFEISYAPSATVLALCEQRARNQAGQALVFGVADPLIPAVADEARAIAGHLGAATVHVNEQATLEAFSAAAPGSRILHLACHGLFRADNPMFSALKLVDGWLIAADILRIDLSGALVVLSACESGRGEAIGGDEILGLTRVFLGAGATTVVVSLWLVQDQTTAELMSAWYDRLGNQFAPAAALREAQLEIKKRHPHPYYWAPFVLVGKR